MACRWPPPIGMPTSNGYGPPRPVFYQPPPPGHFSPQTCWAPPPPNPWQDGQHPWPMPRHPQKSNGNKKKQRKEPVFIHFCDVCDRGFKNIAKKDEHFRQHIKCDEPGCNFEAHFKIVAVHKQNLHGSNASKIKLQTPEDIDRWRNERKRKYPTLLNVELKAEKALEEKEMGNVLQNKYFGKIHHKKIKPDRPKSAALATAPVMTDKSPVLKPLNLLFCNSVNVSDDGVSSDEEQRKSTVASNADQSVGLGSLMLSYASSSEDDEVVTASPQLATEAEKECLRESPLKEVKTDNSKKEVQSKQGGRWKNGKNKSSSAKRQSLLEMLLAPEIRRERNQILQCVRYIVKNNFFEDQVKK